MKDQLFILLQQLVPQKLLSRLAGAFSRSKLSAKLIPTFVRRYQVNMDEALLPAATDYINFHDFFTRQLKPTVRPIAKSIIVSPCDGAIADIGRVHNGQLLQAKQHSFSLEEISACKTMTDVFANGHHATLYLSPKDYHRVHMPCAARLQRWRYLPGRFFSVNTTTARLVSQLYAKNERLVCHFDSAAGQFLLIMVGAMLVSGIVTGWHGKHQLGCDSGWQNASLDFQKTDELGQFCFGSTVVLIMEHSFPQWLEQLSSGQLVLLGQALTA